MPDRKNLEEKEDKHVSVAKELEKQERPASVETDEGGNDRPPFGDRLKLAKNEQIIKSHIVHILVGCMVVWYTFGLVWGALTGDFEPLERVSQGPFWALLGAISMYYFRRK